MVIKDLVEKYNFEVLNLGNEKADINSVYCCDLLSVVMSKAANGCAWVTVMGNINSVAVASLVEASCIVLADSATIDAPAIAKAEQQKITILRSTAPIFETAMKIHLAIQNG